MAENIAGEISATACSLEYKWVIDYACLFGKNVGDVLQSPVFTTLNIGIYDSCQWQLLLYPNGSEDDFEDEFSIYLHLLSAQDFKVPVSIKIINNEGKLVRKYQYTHEYNTTNRYDGHHNFIRRNFITKEEEEYDSDDKLTIICTFIVRWNGEENEDDKNILMTDVYKKYNQLADDFEELIGDKEFADVKFLIESKELWAHKSILRIRSPVFAAMFRNEMKENHENKVEITDIEYEVFLEMLRYIYAEKVNSIEKIAGELLAAADKYLLDDLKLLCEKSLTSNLNAENSLETLRHADLHNIEGLKAKCIELIVSEAASIVDKPEFRQLPCNIVRDVRSALANKKK